VFCTVLHATSRTIAPHWQVILSFPMVSSTTIFRDGRHGYLCSLNYFFFRCQLQLFSRLLWPPDPCPQTPLPEGPHKVFGRIGTGIRESNCKVDTLALVRPNTVRTRIIGPEARTLELPLLVRSVSFFFFLLSQAGAEGVSFRCALAPLSRRGNFGRLCLGSNYSSSYGTL